MNSLLSVALRPLTIANIIGKTEIIQVHIFSQLQVPPRVGDSPHKLWMKTADTSMFSQQRSSPCLNSVVKKCMEPKNTHDHYLPTFYIYYPITSHFLPLLKLYRRASNEEWSIVAVPTQLLSWKKVAIYISMTSCKRCRLLASLNHYNNSIKNIRAKYI